MFNLIKIILIGLVIIIVVIVPVLLVAGDLWYATTENRNFEKMRELAELNNAITLFSSR